MIDPDVLMIAGKWGLDPALIQAVVTAEGDIVKAVQCSLPAVNTRSQAIDVLCRSCAHALVDYMARTDPDGFIAFWQSRWAPTGVANDPTNLNVNWAANVELIWKKDRAV